MKKIVNAIEDLKVDIEKAKLEAGEIVENVQKWGATIEQRTDEADLEISDLSVRRRKLCSIGNERKN